MEHLHLSNIYKSFLEGKHKIDVLKNISLNLYNGKWYTLYGSSGSGKTTLLNIIAGIEKPDSGKLLEDEIEVYSLDDKKLSAWRNENIGFVFQMFHLISSLNVRDNILIPLVISNRRIDESWYSNIIKILDIKDIQARKVYTLSGGEKQRVALARAAINRPRFIVADEPTGNLDSENSKQVIKLLEKMQNEFSVGIIMATHEKELVIKGDAVYHLKDGTIEL